MELSKRALHANLEVSSLAAAMELEGRGQVMLLRDPEATAAIEAARVLARQRRGRARSEVTAEFQGLAGPPG
jgi:hypothetical protein